MPVWEIIGPVMTGPSSSHTAGAAHIGRIVRMCWGGEVKRADLYMRGSFASTGAGHGTDKALIAGLMGMTQDDPEIRNALALARAAGMDFHFYTEEVAGAHPNSVRVVVGDGEGRTMEAVGYSIGGGAVLLQKFVLYRVVGERLRALGIRKEQFARGVLLQFPLRDLGKNRVGGEVDGSGGVLCGVET